MSATAESSRSPARSTPPTTAPSGVASGETSRDGIGGNSRTDCRVMVLDRFLLTDKVAVVTGAGRGIGAAIARTFAEAGADVVIASRTKEQLDEVAAEVAALGRRAVTVPFDMNETDRVGELVDVAVNEFGRVDIVVNNAGGTGPRP